MSLIQVVAIAPATTDRLLRRQSSPTTPTTDPNKGSAAGNGVAVAIVTGANASPSIVLFVVVLTASTTKGSSNSPHRMASKSTQPPCDLEPNNEARLDVLGVQTMAVGEMERSPVACKGKTYYVLSRAIE
jgi:hypothetical protein